MNNNAAYFLVDRPGVLSLIQDAGRFGQTHLGLTQGGPADKFSFNYCHKLLGNQANSSAIEIVAGGVRLISYCQTLACVTGADMSLRVNGKSVSMWRTFVINVGDVIEFDFVKKGLRSYFSVAGGFHIKPEFGSCSTVVRENIGGLCGQALKQHDKLPATSIQDNKFLSDSAGIEVQKQFIPRFESSITLRVILGYQHEWFSDFDKSRFFSNRYEVSHQFDRMGYRLMGAKIKANKTAMLSEGIALGAIQIPEDGQPIILLNDRQTIGGYPKIGSVLSIDLDKLSQCKQGDLVQFEAISIEKAHNILHLDQQRINNIKLGKTVI